MVKKANDRSAWTASSRPAMNQVSDSWSACKPSAAGKSSWLSPGTRWNGYLRQSLLMSGLGDVDGVVLVGAEEFANLVDVVVGRHSTRRLPVFFVMLTSIAKLRLLLPCPSRCCDVPGFRPPLVQRGFHRRRVAQARQSPTARRHFPPLRRTRRPRPGRRTRGRRRGRRRGAKPVPP